MVNVDVGNHEKTTNKQQQQHQQQQQYQDNNINRDNNGTVDDRFETEQIPFSHRDCWRPVSEEKNTTVCLSPANRGRATRIATTFQVGGTATKRGE